MATLTTLLLFILILGVTIFVHELGHFIFAKRAKAHVFEFALGMGPRIWSFKRKNDPTVYSLRLFPIGGFVSIAGEGHKGEEDLEDSDLLQNKKWHQRFLTMVAGAGFNFLFAILVLFFIGLIWGSPKLTPIMGVTPDVIQEMPAYQAGLREGDKILSINGDNIASWEEFMVRLEGSMGETVTITAIDKTGVEKTVEITPIPAEEEGRYIYGVTRGFEYSHGPLAAAQFSIERFGTLVRTMFVTLQSLFTGQIGMDKLAGPVGIYQIVDQSQDAGIQSVLYLVAFLSINVGFINLLPFPAFDGGRILFLLIEGVIRRPVKPEVENTIHGIGFLLLIGLLIYVTFNDVLRIFG